MKAGSWTSIFTTYAFGVLAVAALAKFIPLRAEFVQFLHATPGQYAWLISLLGLPAALFAAPSGAIVDRFGPRAVLVSCGVIGILVDLGYCLFPSVPAYQVLRLIEGVTLVGFFNAGPTLLMATTSGRRGIAAMTISSTFTPVGSSLGLALAGACAGAGYWRTTFGIHGAMLLLVSLIALRLPAIPRVAASRALSTADRLRRLASSYRQGRCVLLAVAFFMIMSVGFGANTVLPVYLARVHELNIALSSNLVAGSTLMMIVGAFLVGALLARGIAPRQIMIGLALGACASGTALFWPGTALAVGTPLLSLWFTLMGGGTTLLLAAMPRVARSDQIVAVAGLLNQAGAIATFVTPPIWLALFGGGGWTPFALIVGFYWVMGTTIVYFLPMQHRASGAVMAH